MKKTTGLKESKRKTAFRVIALNISFFMVFLNVTSFPSGFAGSPSLHNSQGHQPIPVRGVNQPPIPMGSQPVHPLASSSPLSPAGPQPSLAELEKQFTVLRKGPQNPGTIAQEQNLLSKLAPMAKGGPQDQHWLSEAKTWLQKHQQPVQPKPASPKLSGAEKSGAQTPVLKDQGLKVHEAAPKSDGVHKVAAPKWDAVLKVSAEKKVSADKVLVDKVLVDKVLADKVLEDKVLVEKKVSAPVVTARNLAAQAPVSQQLQRQNSPQPAGSHSQQQPQQQSQQQQLQPLNAPQPQPVSRPVSQSPFQRAVSNLEKGLAAIQAAFNLNQADNKSTTDRFNKAEEDGRKKFSTAFNSAQTQAQADSTNWQRDADAAVADARAQVRAENEKALTAFNDHFRDTFYGRPWGLKTYALNTYALESAPALATYVLKSYALRNNPPPPLEQAIQNALKKFTDETDTAITKLNTDTKKVHDTADKEITRLKNELSKETEKAKKDIQNALKTGETAIDEAAKLPRTEGLLEVARARRVLKNAGIEAGNNLEQKGVGPFFDGTHTALVKHDRDSTDALNRNSL